MTKMYRHEIEELDEADLTFGYLNDDAWMYEKPDVRSKKICQMMGDLQLEIIPEDSVDDFYKCVCMIGYEGYIEKKYVDLE